MSGAPVVGLVLLVALVAACSGGGSNAGGATARTPLPGPAVQEHTIDVGGQSRNYRLYAPLSLDRAHPTALVLIMGGVGNTPDGMVQATGFDQTAQTDNIVLAYPVGINNTWNAGYCCLVGAPSGPDDVTFLGRVIDDVESREPIDRSRVYAVGVSAGAMMAYRLGCELAPRIAGVGSVAGAMILDDCHPSQPVSVVEIHGTVDPEVPYQGGATSGGATQPSPPTVAVVQRWAQLDGCPSTPPATQVQSPVTTTTWSGCRGGSAVKLIVVDGGTHTWFASGFGPVSGAVDATTEIWKFLSAHRLGA